MHTYCRNQYSKDETCFTVGYWNLYCLTGQWVTLSDHATEDEAAQRVHYLNGGSSRVKPPATPMREGIYHAKT